jgi:4-hydroxybenzoate polyprenyltransferase
LTTVRSIQLFAKDIKLSHSIFALPFALSALTFLSFDSVTFSKIILIVVCMVSARSFAMGMNRYLDHEIDSKNPRTATRMIPSSQILPKEMLLWSLFFGAVLVLFAFMLSPLAGILSFPLLGILAGYSVQKRFTWLCHLYLGMCLGFAPIAVEIALTGAVTVPVIMIGLGVMFWTAGFDVIYSLQDREFDKTEGLNSIPQRFGFATAINLSRMFFALMIFCLFTAGIRANSGSIYFGGLALIAAILFGEHILIRDTKINGRSKYLNKAFFDFNAFVSLFFLVIALADVLWK